MKLIQSIQNIPVIESEQPVLRFTEPQIKALLLDAIFEKYPNVWMDEYPQFELEVLTDQSTNTVEVVIYQQP